eukprot:Pgem_evm1s672
MQFALTITFISSWVSLCCGLTLQSKFKSPEKKVLTPIQPQLFNSTISNSIKNERNLIINFQEVQHRIQQQQQQQQQQPPPPPSQQQQLQQHIQLQLQQLQQHSSYNNNNNNNYGNDIENLPLIHRALNKARSVYCPEEQIFPKYSCTPCTTERTDGSKNTATFVGHSKQAKTIWLSFRGTQATSIKNWLTDFNIKFVPLDNQIPDVLVHQGMYTAWSLVKEEMIAEVLNLRQQYHDFKVGVTGHSLGGGLATIASCDLSFNHSIPISNFITFGQPRVGNKDFVNWWYQHFENTFVRRITHSSDVIPHTLPWGGYEHFGPELWQKDDDFTNNRLCIEGEDQTCSGSKIPLFTALFDHLTYFTKHVGTSSCKTNHDHDDDVVVDDDDDDKKFPWEPW